MWKEKEKSGEIDELNAKDISGTTNAPIANNMPHKEPMIAEKLCHLFANTSFLPKIKDPFAPIP
ncbi:hypothetical protein CO179_05655 [candidate division WWE3 bacterium CG_4_9_14_3_um_filter_39_7]|uniref:Uncharacterized protein n=1 Tax=candidate division WWE3 bacterium CG_4_9_14_3_um_filter_39_7 TaxID=1975080 RepID=A0A2M7WZY1_UNCKA|nr:MAG: hypothetical protein CO179_05655 [candidate division WWE3 bacterium CG_4_9_14_3_um_filter_39_7]